MRVSVIIPNFNRADALAQTLQGLTEQRLPSDAFEVVVVDDGSTDSSVEIVEQMRLPCNLRLLQQPNKGPGAARNLGAQHARADCYVFLDADMIPAPDLLYQYVQAYTENPKAIVIGRILVWPEAYRSLFDQVTGVELFHDLGDSPIKPAFYNVASGNFSICQQQFEMLGGFDESLKMTEDTDFGYRAQQMGVPIVYWSPAVGYHNHPKTLKQRCDQAHSSARWTARLLAKHPDMRGLLPIYKDIEPISWREDAPSLVAWKVTRRAIALAPARDLLERLARWVERFWPHPKALRFLYWKILSAHRVNGFRAGFDSRAYLK